jgi:hypothetical protein
MIKTKQKVMTERGMRTVQIVKNTWILEMPPEICNHEGLALGTLVSLTIKDHGIQAEFIRPPSAKLQAISKRLLRKNKELYEELKRVGD